MNRPLCNFEIKAFYCLIELYVNDILVFCHYEENGSVWVDWPINQYILESGIQNFEVRIFPYKEQKLLSEKAYLEIGIHTIDFLKAERVEIIEKKAIQIPNKIPFYVHKGFFNVIVPYKNIGWKSSLDLRESDKENLFIEIMEWNSKLLEIYKNSLLTEYNKIFSEREREFSNSYYIEYKESSTEIFHSKFKKLSLLPNDLYKLKFYANGKIVSVKLPNELPGFTYIPEDINDEDGLGISLILFFHRKSKGMPLTIIR